MSQISEENLKRYKETFKTFDENNDDTLCVKELKDLEPVLQCAGYNLTEGETNNFMSEFDKDGNQKIDFDEFVAFMEKVQTKHGPPEEQDKELLEAFTVFDQDGSGFLEREEIKKLLMEDATDEEVDVVINEADTNNDGKIEIKELCKLLATLY